MALLKRSQHTSSYSQQAHESHYDEFPQAIARLSFRSLKRSRSLQ
ncbi:hypothetical protein CKA32_003808 [Geitlerinema sp. FC II]|nr:hypothetical protein CKA32_003808 [Geitlerinema sp. FC II]